MYTVLIADDQVLFRDVARTMFQSTDSFEVVGDATDGEDALKRYDELHPDLVLMDVLMERMDGLQATRRLKEKDSEANVLLTSMSRDAGYARLADELDLVGFVPKRELQPTAIKTLMDERFAAGALPQAA